ncbi:MAG: exosortase O [Chloroflexota bacterium]|nr:MAG: exosortase O [Chloroflexota bacterium]
MFPPRNFPASNSISNLRAHAPQIVWNGLLLALWLGLYRAMFDYLGIIALREDFRTNQLVLLAIIALIGWQIHTKNFQLEFHLKPRPYPLPLTLALGGSMLYLIAARALDINTLSATLFGIASYGFIGLWMAPRSWRAGLPAALLLIAVLPFGEHMQTFLGYPMRIFTAELVRDGLAAFHVTSTGVDTILVLENGVSQIDLPCSGVKSLWTGAIFFIAVTWLDRRALNLRWLCAACAFGLLLFLANVLRVGALVVTAQVLNVPIFAEMLHVPLGVLGFVGACAAAVWLLRFKNKNFSEIFVFESDNFSFSIPQFSIVLAFLIAGMGLLYTSRAETGLSQNAPVWHFPSALQTHELPLKPDEIAWLTRDGAESATRLKFTWQDISGSMILVPSRTWRAHHRPERCFEVFGLQLNDSRAQMIADNFPIRAVVLRDPKSDARLDAAYWFQSATRTTDDYGTRIWADTAAPAERWVLVSILFDQPLEPNDARAVALYRALHQAVAQQLAE